ncbi:MAG: 2-oxoglutarate dehydrogenase complex E2 component [Peltula sp. TS41687]|nr:MAG: 2-oxoglutarate dehydrogenase complex E2 component [Peltula sp. TS41687]
MVCVIDIGNSMTYIDGRVTAEKIVKVPQMAESISEGTLKQWSKRTLKPSRLLFQEAQLRCSAEIGDHVERDEEIATIETDKIDVAVNAPEAGTIKEFLAKEEDTVTVGQDLVKMELGEGAGGKEAEPEKAGQEPKAPASKDQPTASDPNPSKKDSKETSSQPSPPSPSPSEKKRDPPQESKREPKESSAPSPSPQPSSSPSPKSESSKASTGSDSPFGKREERRVCQAPPQLYAQL